jgi:tetratricopeptide (TPR) repeat protein
MAGRREETLAALRKARAAAPEPMLLSMPGLDWSIGFLYEGLVRFGRWEEMLKEPAPDPRLPGLTISWHQARAVALAATGRLAEAKKEVAALDRLVPATPADATQGLNAARPLYEIGVLKARARIAQAGKRHGEAIRLLTEAVAKEDTLSYNEPSDEFFPVRHLLGAALLDAGRAREAEAVYREDLRRNPANGWSLKGLARALAAQKRLSEAGRARRAFDAAWTHADVRIDRSAY